MKKLLLLACMSTLYFTSAAQTWEEWTQQDQTAIKRLQEQILANHSFSVALKKGYSLFRNGLKSVNTVRNKDTEQHAHTFDQLGRIAPVLKNTQLVNDALAIQIKVMQTSRSILTQARSNGQLSSAETVHVEKVIAQVWKEALQDLTQLSMILTDKEYFMKDAARLSQLAQLKTRGFGRLAFLQSFGTELSVLQRQRVADQVETDYSKRLNGF